MNVIYICRVSDYQVSGNQIDIPKKVAIEFFNVPESNIEEGKNTGINICHSSDLTVFEIIEIQPATNLRWSTKLNTFLAKNGDSLTKGCLLIFEKIERSFCIHTIKDDDAKYDALVDLFAEGDSHMLLSASFSNLHKAVNKNASLQQIFYGAPGTGKSNTIKEQVDDRGEICFRTTFHPDSDYSTFVGCYKPKSHKKNMLDGNGYSLAQLLSRFFDSYDQKYQNAKKARYLYEALVNTKDIRNLGLDAQAVADKLNAQNFKGCAYTTEATCMYNIYDWLKEDGYIVENKISYEFTPQAFTLAYIEAWKQYQKATPVYLVIEEINRGNCAQIFGDIFQLLDRDDFGFSQYDITPDSDLQEYITEQGLDVSGITDAKGNDISANIIRGEKMKLPPNLYIWATMNTSDQSLFPIDSAFKRRWDWKYIPIKEHPDKNYKIEIGEKTYDWWGFLERINKVIGETTSSEDKKLGYFFVKTETSKVSDEQFVGKVLFYLWNDVFKNYGLDHTIFSKGDKDKFVFSDFFNADGTPNKDNVQLFLKRLEDTIKIDRPLDVTPKEESTTVSEETTVSEA